MRIRLLHPLAFVLLLAVLSVAMPAAPAAAQPTQPAAEVDTSKVVPAPDPRPSPLRLARVFLGDSTYVKVHYSSPSKRGREIFGTLVPYGELWRTAANENSEITFTRDVVVAGHVVKAGTYTLLTIPGQDEWTIILNRALGSNGTEDYDAALDEVRFTAVPTTNKKMWEAFTITLDEANGGADMALRWDMTGVVIPIRTR